MATLGLAVLSLVFLKPSRQDAHRVVLGNETAKVSPFGEATTLRNVTKADITYVIEANPYTRSSTTRTLKIGDVDKIRTNVPLEITYYSGTRTTLTTVFPGRPYSFRYDANGLVRVYPGSHGREDAADLAPYVPTPQAVVERMLEMAGVGRDDVVYDIGCGDGRMVITAAKKYQARGVGIDIDEKFIQECRAKAKSAGVEHLTRFLCLDGTKAHITEATVLALYLLPESLETLRPLFEKELRPGGRIVSHNYMIPGWDSRLVKKEVLPDEGGGREHKIYLYVVTGERKGKGQAL